MRAVELIGAGAVGRPQRVEAEFSFDGDFTGAAAGNYRLDAARGGGALYDVGCYAVDAVRWGLRAGPLEVQDVTADVRDGVDVRTSARLRSGDGGVAEIRCGIRGSDEQLVAVYGDSATLVLGSPSFTARDVACQLHLQPAVDGPTAEAMVEEFAPVDPYRLMVEAVAAVVGGRDVGGHRVGGHRVGGHRVGGRDVGAQDVWLPTAQDSLDIAAVLDDARARAHGRAVTGRVESDT